MERIIIVLLLTIVSSNIFGQDKLLSILKKDLNKQMKELSRDSVKPYYISYRVEDKTIHYISSSNGSLTYSDSERSRVFLPQVRVGSYEFDNFNALNQSSFGQVVYARLPYDDVDRAISETIAKSVKKAYKAGNELFMRLKETSSVRINKGDTASDYTKIPPKTYIEKPLPASVLKFDREKWNNRVCKLSSHFKSHDFIKKSSVDLSYKTIRKYFVSTENVVIVENLTYATLHINVETKADDGMILPLYKSYFAFNPSDLPSDEILERDINVMIAKLVDLRNAPVVDPYTGPAILSGASAGVFFHEIFGHRIEGQSMKSSTDGNTFKSMVNQKVLPNDISVYDDPTLKKYNGIDMFGWYHHDDEGVLGSRVQVVKSGVLKNFLMSRVPLEGFPESNGHSRGEIQKHPTSRQSNLLITTSSKYSEADLRNMLIDEAKRQNKEYGFYMANVTGGFTNTSVNSPSSFNVTPIEVYKVYVDGRPDELVRGVNLVGTPLSMFSFITAAGGNIDIFSGMCGASSGYIPVTAISPALFITKIEFQKKATSNIKDPILPRPY